MISEFFVCHNIYNYVIINELQTIFLFLVCVLKSIKYIIGGGEI